MTVKKTALFDEHMAHHAQMVEFASTWLPVRYQSEKEEHLCVRQSVGMFDVSHMGEFLVEGENALDFLQRILTNDVERLAVNQAQYTLLLNNAAGIVDDLIVYRLDTERFLLCVNAANIHNDERHILGLREHEKNLRVANVCDQFAQIALQGKDALPLLQLLCSEILPERFWITQCALSGINSIVAATGYTGEKIGFEIFVDNNDAKTLWQMLLHVGQDFGLKPCGLAARDSLRLEAGLLLHGQDMNDQTSPLEAGLMFAVDIKKPNFVGKDALVEQIRRGADKKMLGFRMIDRGIARHGFSIVDENGHNIGIVTSGSLPPTQENSVGLAYIDRENAVINKPVFVDIRGRLARAVLMKPRFFKG